MPTLTNNMMRQIIMDHYSNPLNKHQPTNGNFQKMHMHSENCIDDLDIFLEIEDNRVKDACFDGTACTISTASTDIMCDLLKGKSLDDALNIVKQYDNMIHEQPFDEEALDEAVVFINTSKQAARIRCAMIGYLAADQILKGQKNG